MPMSSSSSRCSPDTPPPTERFLSKESCAALAARVTRFAKGGGESRISISTSSFGTVRFARNQIRTSRDVRNNDIAIMRNIMGARVPVVAGNQIDDVSILAMVRRAERLILNQAEVGDSRLEGHDPAADPGVPSTIEQLAGIGASSAFSSGLMDVLNNSPEVYADPKLFFDSTFEFDPAKRAAAVEPCVKSARAAGMQTAGYIVAEAVGNAVIDTWGHHLYHPRTEAMYTVTVRSPDGSGSGWAGVNWNDWDRVDAVHLSEIALDKCLRSRNPVRVEPGRYTVVLEPQAVHDICWPLFTTLDRLLAEGSPGAQEEHGAGVFARGNKTARIGERVFDPRVNVSQDPMDPDCGAMPFDSNGNAIYPATWVKHGVLTDLPYFRNYAIAVLGKNTGLPLADAYRMTGDDPVSIDDMVKSTKRGIYVTRFTDLQIVDSNSMLMTGFTRDGTWLIENGAITKAIKNFRFTESPMFMLNNVDALGPAQRVYARVKNCPFRAAIVPSIKAHDFSFTSLTDAV